MATIDIATFLEDLKLAEIISWKTSDAHAFHASQDDSSTEEFDNLLKQVNDIVAISEKSNKIPGESIDVIQSLRQSAYNAIRAAEDKKAVANSQITKDQKEKAISKAQKDFDAALKKKLIDYFLEAQVYDKVNVAHVELQSKRKSERKMRHAWGPRPVDPELIEAFLCLVESKSKSDLRALNVDTWLDSLTALSKSQKDYIKEIAPDVIDDLIYMPRELGETFCASIFDNDPYVSSKQILLREYPEIKEGVFVSFLRIILYPFKLVVDYLDKKTIYGLDELRLFKDGKEKPRDEKGAAACKKNRFFNYGSPVKDSVAESLKKDIFLREVKLGAGILSKGKKQHYAVLNCFKGQKNPPNGTVIVFHGKNADIHTKPFIDSCKSICEGYRVIMMEYPGFEPSSGPLSKKNISDVTYKLFEDAKKQGLIKGDLTVMGEDFGSYYAALLAKNINEKEPGFCKGLMISESFNSAKSFNSANSDLSKSKYDQIASYLSTEHLDTKSVLQKLPRTLSVVCRVMPEETLDAIYPKKATDTYRPKPYMIAYHDDGTKLPVINYSEDTDSVILDKQNELNRIGNGGLEALRYHILENDVLMYGKKPFSAYSASKVGDQKEQGLAK